MKFVYYNDTNRMVTIHPATQIHGCEVDMRYIAPQEERVFTLPQDTYPWVKMWDNGSHLQILVSPRSLEADKPVSHEPSAEVVKSMSEEVEGVFSKYFAKINPHNKGGK